jgi:transposase-like protein
VLRICHRQVCFKASTHAKRIDVRHGLPGLLRFGESVAAGELACDAIPHGLRAIAASGERVGAVTRVARQLSIGPESPRNWVKQADVDNGKRPGMTTEQQRRMTELEREVRELTRIHVQNLSPRTLAARTGSETKNSAAAAGVRETRCAAAAQPTIEDEAELGSVQHHQ